MCSAQEEQTYWIGDRSGTNVYQVPGAFGPLPHHYRAVAGTQAARAAEAAGLTNTVDWPDGRGERLVRPFNDAAA